MMQLQILSLLVGVLLVNSQFSAVQDVLFIMKVKGRVTSDDIILKYRDKASLLQSGFDSRKPTVVEVHGYAEDHNCIHHVILTEALVEAYDQNVINVDWSIGAKSLDYFSARNQVENVGIVIAQQLDFLHERVGLNMSSVTVIGFSLGAHIAGFTGKNVKTGRIGKIVGLDPAGPLFDINNPSARLDAKDGVYVIAVHTGEPYGIRKALAKADFFFNTGEKQPGCFGGGWADVCSHLRAVNYYAESVRIPESFWGIRCSSEAQALTGQCSDEPNASLGDPKLAKGIFSIRTNGASPFGIGKRQ